MADKRKCRVCGTEFVLFPDKPGNINDCLNCAVDVPRKAAKVAWSGKHFMEMEIVASMDEARLSTWRSVGLAFFHLCRFHQKNLPLEGKHRRMALEPD
jgi:hypothetical protein